MAANDDPTTAKNAKSVPIHAAAVATTPDEKELTVSFLKPTGERVSHTVPASHAMVSSFQQTLERFEADFEGIAAWFESEKAKLIG